KEREFRKMLFQPLASVERPANPREREDKRDDRKSVQRERLFYEIDQREVNVQTMSGNFSPKKRIVSLGRALDGIEESEKILGVRPQPRLVGRPNNDVFGGKADVRQFEVGLGIRTLALRGVV